MYAENLNAQLLAALERPDLRVVSATQRISFDASLEAVFHVGSGGEVVLGAACLGSQRVCAFHLRHALELSMLLEAAGLLKAAGCCDLAILAGLCAARVAAQFWQLDGPSDAAEPEPWLAAMAGEIMPLSPALDLVWMQVRPRQAAEPDAVPAAVVRRLRSIWDVLGPAESLMARGGDARLAVNARTGLNHYGCSHRPRPWAITFASSTASSLSERGFGGAEAARRRITASALVGDGAEAGLQEAEAVRRGIAAYYELPPGCEVVLAASGTDCELLVLALAGQGEPLSTVLTAPEETGTGVPLAAAGKHFAEDTSGRQQVRKGAPVAGFRTDTRVLPLPVRAADGTPRPEGEIETECAALVRSECCAGRHVLLHLLDLSKTGLLAPSLACLERLQAEHGDAVSIVVDACQARLEQWRVRDYLTRGWTVMVTGSKFFTGPPFCGAVLVPQAAAARLADCRLPAGLSAYGSQADWPPLAAVAHLPRTVNLGMVLRWQAALAEMQAFAAVPPATARKRLALFLAGVLDAIAAREHLVLLEVPAPDRPPPAAAGQRVPSWDQLRTIISFLVLEAGPVPGERVPLTMARARQLYRWLNADVSTALPKHATEAERRVGGLLCHVGQPAPVPHAALGCDSAGALRISAGARLVSGEPSHQGLDAERRVSREIADARRVLDKIDLLLRYWTAMQAADPEPSYAPGC